MRTKIKGMVFCTSEVIDGHKVDMEFSMEGLAEQWPATYLDPPEWSMELWPTAVDVRIDDVDVPEPFKANKDDLWNQLPDEEINRAHDEAWELEPQCAEDKYFEARSLVNEVEYDEG